MYKPSLLPHQSGNHDNYAYQHHQPLNEIRQSKGIIAAHYQIAAGQSGHKDQSMDILYLQGHFKEVTQPHINSSRIWNQKDEDDRCSQYFERPAAISAFQKLRHSNGSQADSHIASSGSQQLPGEPASQHGIAYIHMVWIP